MNITIIGSGPAGVYSAIASSKMGHKVKLIEKNDKLGGTCVLYGCIPSKAMLHPLFLKYSTEELGRELNFSFAEIQKIAKNVVNRLSKGVEYMLESYGVEVIHDRAELNSGNIQIGGQTIPSDRIIVATGTEKPQVKGTIASDDLPYLDKDFSKVLVIGGGAGGVEYAWLLKMAGKDVSIAEKSDSLLPYLDEDLRKAVTSYFKKIGIKLYLSSEVNLEKPIDEPDVILYTFGRKPVLKGFEELPHEKYIKVDKRMYTGVSNIYAAGDVIGTFTAHEAIHEGFVAGLNAGGVEKYYNPEAVPKVIYTEPQIAYVGNTKGKCVKINMAEIPRAIAEGLTEGFLKVCAEEKKISGAVAFSQDAEDIVTLISTFMNYNIDLEKAIDFIEPHPSYLEAVFEALLRLNS
ncbi:NAD(P)/FAD-dependent oxidoreductase [Acidianus sp. HS-5]|uniref:dihydrolipoyl dehydrogenase family protein n=1 Tax=Acidianus sp. HS-5 TaxID=2886040 RepID=UPI001F3F2700|nr:NAD(P)/FAD-dependent oxidoreductase [Acidianus sp. HS-5]BDC19016.1 pyridine nucleotide-disulfide oxidoreductase [Acidianus sp. HS-5]